MTLTPGQAGDDPALLPLVDGYFGAEATADAVGDVRLLADKAYSHPSTRTALRKRRIKHTIPERDDQVTRRKAKGSAGGRPPSFDGEIYKQRNTVERGFNRLKQWRGIATRYDKYALTFLGGVLLAAWIREHAPQSGIRRHALGGDLHTAEEFAVWGVIDRVVPSDELHNAAEEFARRLAAGPTRAFSVVKDLIRAYTTGGVMGADSLLTDAAVGLFDTEDARGGIESFLTSGPGHAAFAGR